MTTEAKYIKISFPLSTEQEEIQGFLTVLEPLGIIDEDDHYDAFFLTEVWRASAKGMLDDYLAAVYPGHGYVEEALDIQNWNATWEESIQPIRISERFIVAPTWHPVEAGSSEIVLTIDPKMSFGTGYHATTRLMLRLLENAVTGGEHVFDVGTGTGILAIAAIKLGAASAAGVDTDEWSLDNANENLERNGLAEEVRFYHGSTECVQGETFDLILSNITRNDNISMLPELNRLLSANGRLILSGFYATDKDEMEKALDAQNMEIHDAATEDEWIALSVHRRAV